MKIIVLGTRGFPNVQGGVERHCEQLYPVLVQLGCDVTVLTRRPYIDPSIQEYQKVKLVAVNCPKQKFLEAIAHTFAGVCKARAMGCDILHVHAVGPSLLIPLARILGLKVVMTNHGPDYMRKKWNRVAKLTLQLGERMGSRYANGIICISKGIANDIKKKYKREPAIIPNGVIIPPPIETKKILKRFDLLEKKYIIVVGRFVPEKGFHDLVDAFSSLKTPALAEYRLVIVGDADHEDDYSRSLKEKARRLPRVVLTGLMSGQDLQELYAHAGIFVLPSYYEGLPIVLLEALSYGLSCVVSDIPANLEVALEQERYFKAGDIQGMMLKMEYFLLHPLTTEQKAGIVNRVAKDYNWQTIARKTLEIYKQHLS